MRWTPEVPADGYEAFAVSGSPAQRAVLAAFGGRMAIILGVAMLAVVGITPGSSTSRLSGVAVGTSGIITGALLIRHRRRIPFAVLDAMVPTSLAVFAWVGILGEALVPLIPYVFTVYAAQVYAMRSGATVVMHSVALGAGYAAVLVWGPDTGPPITHWVAVMTAIVSSAYFVRWLMGKVQTLARAEHEARSEAEAAGDALAEVSRVKSRFLARVSHELRTPLNAVVGFSDLLQSGVAGPLTEQQGAYVDDVRSSSRHLHSLVDDVLDLASVESGSPSVDLEPVPLAEVVSEAVTMVRSQAATKHIAMNMEIGPDVGEVAGDRRKIRQVVINLVSNAVKFTEQSGRVDIAVEGRRDDVVVSVADTGVGIDQGDRDRIFEAYQRGNQPGEGTGLGLAVARRLVELHGGDLWVESMPGQGSSFSFRLPRRPTISTGTGVDAAKPGIDDELVMAFARPGSEANRTMLGQIGAAFGLLAAALGVVVAIITPGDLQARAGVGLGAMLGLGAALVFRLRAQIPTLVVLDVFAAVAITVISGAAVWSGEFADVVPLAYLWVVLVAAALHTRGRLLARVLMVAVAYAFALSFSPGTDADPGRWVSVMMMLVVNVAVVDWAVNRIREVAASEAAARRHAELVRSELAAISRHQSEFLASMSHELRTPLNAVIGFSDVLASELAGPLTQRQAEFVDEILTAGRHLLDLINDLLDLAKLDAGRLELDVSTISVDNLVGSAAGVVGPNAARAGVEIVEDVATGLMLVSGDANRLEQALCNLLMNAVHSTPPGGRITVRARSAGDGIEIAVADTGTGIDPDQLSEIFAPFHRAPGGTLVSGQPGPGLGLAVVKGLVELHDGTVAVASRPGQGAVFTITLPTQPPSHATGAPVDEVARG